MHAQAVFAEGHHAELDGFLLEDDAGGALVDELADGVGDVEQFVDAFAAFVAGLVADVAAFSVVELLVADLVRGEADLGEDGFAGLVGGAATRADFADEALAEDALEGGGDHEGLDAHVDEAGDGAGGVVGVKGGEDQGGR
jgi:hypothetical protein